MMQEHYLKYLCRAVARSENLGGHIVLGGDNVPPLVEIGLTDLPKSGGARAPPAPPLATGLCTKVHMYILRGPQNFTKSPP